MWIQVAINDGVFFLALHNRRYRKNRQWKSAIARPGCLRIIEKNHFPTPTPPLLRQQTDLFM
jgi:hypothetical protein